MTRALPPEVWSARGSGDRTDYNTTRSRRDPSQTERLKTYHLLSQLPRDSRVTGLGGKGGVPGAERSSQPRPSLAPPATAAGPAAGRSGASTAGSPTAPACTRGHTINVYIGRIIRSSRLNFRAPFYVHFRTGMALVARSQSSPCRFLVTRWARRHQMSRTSNKVQPIIPPDLREKPRRSLNSDVGLTRGVRSVRLHSSKRCTTEWLN